MPLGPGSIAFTGFNADGNDNLAFVALEAIPAGTVIYFTDNEWTGAGFADFAENVFALTITSAVPAGTIVTMDSLGTASPTSNFGTIAAVPGGGTNLGIGNGDETVYAYTADPGTPLVPTAFLTAVANGGYSAGNGLLTGTGLTAGTDALDLSLRDDDLDIAAFVGPRSGQPSLTAYRAVINNPVNWDFQDTGGDQSADGTAPDVPFSTAGFVVGGAVSQTVGFAANSINVARPEGNSGFTALTFTIERTGGITGEVSITGTFTAGETNAADFGGFLPGGFSATIADGAANTTITLQISGDTAIEVSESFTLAITGIVNGAAVPTAAGATGATGTIQSDELGAQIGGITVYNALPSLQGAAAAPIATDDVVLVRLGTFTGSGGTAAGRAESVSYDPVADRLYVTNAAQKLIDVAQLNADGSTTALASINLAALTGFGTVNSVAVKNGIIAVAYDNVTAGQPGYVALYDTATNTLQKLLQAGVLPDHVAFSPDGLKLIVANEGEAVTASNNPAGSVSIIDLSGGAAAATVVATIGFDALSGEEFGLAQRGLALLSGQAAGNDIEPEYVTVSADGSRAYVTLQEVNGVAIIDLGTNSLLAIQPLGGVDRNLAGNAFDPSDQNGVSLVNADVISLLQPDAITSYSVGGITYFITANEGDARVVGGADVGEVVRVNSSYTLDPTAYPNAAALEANGSLGRLNVLTNVGDTDGDGDFDQIYNIGGRGISIFRQNADGSISKVRETGGEFEAIIARDYAALFNTNQNLTSPDSRSDDKGPEPEGVVVGEIGGRFYAFVTLERVGGVMIYDVTDPANAFFVGFRPPVTGDFGPETATFISAADSPTGGALMLTANEISGTTTIYRVISQTSGADLIEGGPDGDRFDGRAGNDTINGLGGDDRLYGGAGNDLMTGGTGNDWYFVDGGDTVVEGASEGTGDRVFASTSYTLSAGAYIENMSTDDHAGTAAIDLSGNELDNLIYGNAGDNDIDGRAGADTMVGFGGDDFFFVDNAGDRIVESSIEGTGDRVFASTTFTLSAGAYIEIFSTDFHTGTAAIDLTGNELNNLIYGNAGSNVLDGKQGNDALVGFGGADTFAFTTALGAGNVDLVFDFDADDLIALDDAVFAGLSLGSLSASAFTTGPAATTADQRIVYNQATGELFYDADGNGAGAQMLFATLDAGTILTASDFTVI